MEFYSTSARILDAVVESSEPVNLRELCTRFASSASASPARCYALVAETLKYLPTLERLLKSIDLLKAEAKLLGKKSSPSSKSLVLVLIHDHLFNKRGISLPKQHKIRAAIERYATRLSANTQREKIRLGVVSNEGLQTSLAKYVIQEGKGKGRALEGVDDIDDADNNYVHSNIRWLRVNEIKWNLQDAVAWLSRNGWKKAYTQTEVGASDSRHFCVDEHISNLLALRSSLVNLKKFEPYLDGRLIAQDKASCMPGYLLLQDITTSEGQDPIVIDATSAPGNKTTYVSARLSTLNCGHVYAIERDQNRYKTLRTMLSKAGCANTEAIHQDFLAIDPQSEPYSTATHILVDPSCSGSGIHADQDANDESLQDRLKPLSQFQRYILSHALRFPKAEKVVYSTCSVHQEENEDVVLSILSRKEFSKTWQIDTRANVLPSWPLRGKVSEGDHVVPENQLEGMIRCDPKLGTHGFFVCVLVRSRDSEAEEPVRSDPGAMPVTPLGYTSHISASKPPQLITSLQRARAQRYLQSHTKAKMPRIGKAGMFLSMKRRKPV